MDDVASVSSTKKLFENAVTVRNQTVLLNGVNNDVGTMKQLIRNLADNNIQPVEIVINKQSLQDITDNVDKQDKEIKEDKEDKEDKQSDKDNSLVSYHIKNLTFPLEIDNKIVEILLKENKQEVNASLQMLYI